MAQEVLIKNYRYGSRHLNFYCLLEDNELPLFAPTLFLFHISIEGQDVKTTKAYAHDLKSFFNILKESSGTDGNGSLDFRDVTDLQMDGYLNGYLIDHRKLSPRTVERHITTLREFYNFSYEYGLIEGKPNFSFETDYSEEKVAALEKATTSFHQMYITEEEFEQVLLANIDVDSSFARERDEIALKLGYYAGLRTEELVINDNLCLKKLRKQLPENTKHIPQAFELTVTGKNDVTRTTLVDVKATKAIHKFIWGRLKGINTSLMCHSSGKPLKDVGHGTSLFRRCVKQYLNENALDEESVNTWLKRSYHVLRKCFTTNAVGFCYENQLDPRVFVTQWLGHSRSETTEDYILYDALLNNRLSLLEELNLDNTTFSRKYKSKFKK